MSTSRQLAEKLLQIKALQINLQKPYTWASGWRSPLYCDNRKVLSYPFVRDYVKSELANLILETYPEAELIAGVATAGLAHGAMAADLLRLPFINVDPKEWKFAGGHIDNTWAKGMQAVLVEDLISMGKSSLQAVEALQELGVEVMGVCALFSYEFPVAQEAFASANIPLHTLSNYSALVQLAYDQGKITEDQKSVIEIWRQNPDKWDPGT